ncbi:MAG: PilN domain-containing protein [Thermodesulfovibrionales bacterium]|nr:PilN domain-containing protein [Thermodesulfovibrionales bacterium]
MTGLSVLKKIVSLTNTTTGSLRKFLIPLLNFLSFDFSNLVLPQKCFSISLEGSHFTLAYLLKIFSKIKVLDFRVYPTEGKTPEPDFLANSIEIYLKELGIKNPSVTLTIPKSWVITKTIEYPSSVLENLSNVIFYEMDRITPIDPEDSLYDFKVISNTAGKVKILLAVTKKQFVSPYIDSLMKKGISVSKITFNISSLDSLIRYSSSAKSNIFVEVDTQRFDGGFFYNSAPLAIFSSDLANKDEDQKLAEIVESIKELKERYKDIDSKPEIILFFKNTTSFLKERLKLKLEMPFKVLGEMDIGISSSKKVDETIYSALGAGVETLWTKSDGFNLLTRGEVKAIRKPISLTVVLITLIISIGVVYAVAPLYLEEKKLEEIERQISARKEEVKKVEALKKEIESLQKDLATIKDFKHSRHMSLAILKELTSITPKNAWFTRVRITEKTVEVEGYAHSATELLPKLESSTFFQKVEFTSPTFRDARMNLDRFNIKMELEAIEKPKEQVKKE